MLGSNLLDSEGVKAATKELCFVKLKDVKKGTKEQDMVNLTGA